MMIQLKSTIFGVTPCLLSLMATICYASTTIIVVKSEVLELLVLRDNWLVTNRKVNLQPSNDSLVTMKTMSHRTMLSKETTKPLNDASTTFFTRPHVTKPIRSWTAI
jgi:hypothetical protein